MSSVGIVCDSTCDLGMDWFDDNDVLMVPLKVMFGEETFLDWVDLSPTEFYRRLEDSSALPTTSQPTPAQFAEAYRSLADKGAREIVSIHLTAALSGTYESAAMAAKDAPVPVRVVNTNRVTQGTGLSVKAAVEARDAGKSGQDIEAIAIDTAKRSHLFFVLDTLEYLVKGGRAGKAAGLAASVLSIKPVLLFNDEGTIEPYSKERGTKNAYAALARHVAELSQGARLRVVVFHAVSPDLADELIAALDEAGVDYDLDSVGSVGAVIGTYAGPRAAGLAFYPLS
jgi:DegV family protein with EDD domain